MVEQEQQELEPVNETVIPPQALDNLTDDEKEDMRKIQRVRDVISEYRGIIPPALNAQCYLRVAHIYTRVTMRVGKYKAMRDEYMAQILLREPNIKIGRAKAIAAGHEWGMRGKFFENVAAGLIEMINALKKNQEHMGNEARNQH